MLLAAADDYLLDLARTDLEAGWRKAHPDGEVTHYDVAPSAARLLQELSSPSLFAPARLLVVRNAASYLAKDKPAKGAARTTGGDSKDKLSEGAVLAQNLGTLRLQDAWLVLVAEVEAVPEGPLVEVVRRRGELRYTPLPAAPKPWDDPGITPAQRQVLQSLVKRVVPDLVTDREVMDALFEAYGFKPRELVQAAARLALSGELTAEAVREQAGPGECAPRELEEALIARDAKRLAAVLGRLAAGTALIGWRGEALAPNELGGFLVRLLGRLIRQALALRAAARQAGCEGDLEPRRCADKFWYPKVFKSGLLPRLQAVIKADAESTLADLSPWQLHRMFKLAAPYTGPELLTALGALSRAGIEREKQPEMALAALSGVLLGLVQRPAGARRAPGG